MRWSYHWQPPQLRRARRHARSGQPRRPTSSGTRCWRVLGRLCRAGASMTSPMANLTWGDLATAVGLGFLTMLRVVVLIALASLIWTPIGVYVGLRPRLTQHRAAGGAVPGRLSRQHPVPAGGVGDRALGPQSRHLAVAADGAGHPMVHPVQRHRRRQHHAARSCATPPTISACTAGCGGGRSRCPPCFPITSPAPSPPRAAPGTPRIVAEVASWGNDARCMPMAWAPISPTPTTSGDFRRVVLGIAVMSFFVVVVNRIFWRPLYWYAERKFRLT